MLVITCTKAVRGTHNVCLGSKMPANHLWGIPRHSNSWFFFSSVANSARRLGPCEHKSQQKCVSTHARKTKQQANRKARKRSHSHLPPVRERILLRSEVPSPQNERCLSGSPWFFLCCSHQPLVGSPCPSGVPPKFSPQKEDES